MAKAKTFTQLGSDLALTRYAGVPSSVPLEVPDSWGSLDLQVVPGGRGGPSAPRRPLSDLGAVSGREPTWRRRWCCACSRARAVSPRSATPTTAAGSPS